MICDSWYIGAFGRWWRGGIVEAWYHDVIARSKDEESWSSGILSMKNLDMLNDYNGLLQTFRRMESEIDGFIQDCHFRRETSRPIFCPVDLLQN